MRDYFTTFVIPILRAVFGEIRWSPPAWIGAVGARGRELWAWLSAARARSPRRFWGIVAAIVIVVAGGYSGWRWYKSLPEPHYLEIAHGYWPGPTPLRPDAKPDPLQLEFSGSAAKLSDVGKKVTYGIVVNPPLPPGTWTWMGDSELVFVPKQDWPVGRDYTIHFSRKLFPSHVLMRDYSYKFSTPQFSASIDSAQFYEDPTNPKIKKVVATVVFSHPVDKTDFEKRISMRMRIEPVKSFDSPDAKSFGFKVTYDKTGGKAFILSDSFGIPNNEAEMLLVIGPGVHSSRGGPGLQEPIERTVYVPGIESYFRIESITAAEVPNDRDEIERIGTVNSSAPMRQSDLAKNISVMLLPKDFPPVGDVPLRKNYPWSDPSEVVPQVMALATPVSVEWIPTEREFSNAQSFKFTAETGRALLVTVKHGLKSFGDYPLVKDYSGIITAGPFPKTVKVISQGSILSLSGDKKISVLTRSVGAVQFEVSRLLPGSVSHLVSQSEGTFSNPQFWAMYGSRTFGFDDLAEVFREVRQLPIDPSGKNQYTVFDFAPLLSSGALPRGLFYLRIREWDVANNQPLPGGASDARLIMLTDLGVLVKDSADGSHDVFVQSIRDGTPVADAEVEILGKNGLAVLSQKTNAEGRATFPTFKDFRREKTPTVYVVEKEGDFSFLPYDRPDRRLNLSRFDTGGVYTARPQVVPQAFRYRRHHRRFIPMAAEIPPPVVSGAAENESLQAYLFSDRGIYRPGDTVHIGLIVKPMDWKPLPQGLPLQIVVSDPRGVEIRSEMVKFAPAGFEEFSTATQEDSPTGSYEFLLYLVRDAGRKVLLGSTSVRVEDFQPDRMTIKADLTAPKSAGWIPPDALGANVTLRNLYGTPAAGRRVKGSLKLTPSAAVFPGYADYQFVDPYKTYKSYDENLGEVMTDADGRAKFDFKLERFDKGLFRLRFIAEGFEPEGGRSVLADAAAVVSPAPYLIAYKADGDLGYVSKGSIRKVNLIAVNPKLARTAVPDLSIELLEFRYVSVLTKQENGTLAFQSVRKEISKEKKNLALPAAGQTLTIPSAEPGSYAYVIRNQKGDELNRIYFDIVGHANVSRSLEREAELKIKLSKPQYAPGEDAELDIQAPYVGAGLITVERDRIYNAKWFRTTTTESVQKIKIPEELEGNGYITVTFVRALDSHEIFTSPLSYGVAAFSIDLARRTQQIKLDTPALVRPGDTLTIGYQAAANTKLVLVAVDEGILQVARYKTPDPLSYFFRKRALEVSTSQILDLILPELHLLNESSATGGDQGKLLARSHNPFKRKGQKPVAFWSGLIDSDGKPGSVDVPVPDYFNGTVRVMAIAVSDQAIGVAEKSVVSQGYFVIQPQAPYFVAPGDQFEVTALVANNVKGAKSASEVTVALQTSDQIEVVKDKTQKVSIAPGTDSTVRFELRAKSSPGTALMTVNVSGSGKQARYTLDMSVRPASPFITSIASGYVKKSLLRSVKGDLPVRRKMYPQYREVEASASALPLGLATGLVQYLHRFPYGCTEQIVSQAFPGVVLGTRPELGLNEQDVRKSLARAVATLQGRQNSYGAFGLWAAGPIQSNFISVYATHFLLEMRDHGLDVPSATLKRALGYMSAMVAVPAGTLPDIRAQAYALYVLARSGVVVGNQLYAIRTALDQNYKDSWTDDATLLYLAATYKLLKMDSEAAQLMKYAPNAHLVEASYDYYYDDMMYRATYLYMVSKYFPEKAKKIPGDQILALADAITNNRENTISSAWTILAFDGYAAVAGTPEQAKIAFSEKLADGKFKPLSSKGDLFARAEVPPEAAAVHVEGDTSFALFYQLSEGGFDLELPKEEIKNGIEVYRDFRNEKGEVITSTSLDSKVYAYVSVRAIETPVSNVAIVDLLPGGFEIDISPQGLGNRQSAVPRQDTWSPSYIDVREDRVVFYGSIGTEERTFVYRLKPSNRGRFVVPPLYAEGMYDRTVQARSLGGTFSIETEAPPPAH